MAGELGSRKGDCGPSAWLPFLFAALFTVGAGLVLFKIYSLQAERRNEATRVELVSQLSVLRAGLEYQLTSPLLITRGLVAQIQSRNGISDEEFVHTVSLLAQDYLSVRNMTLARGTVMAAVYPVDGNKAVIGVDYHSLPTQWPTVERAIRSHRPVVAGPVKLVQGGEALIGRVPIFLADPQGGPARFFGLISVVIDIPKVFAAAGLDSVTRSVDLAIRGRDGLGRSGGMIWGDEAVFERSPVEMAVTLPDGTWAMAAMPKGGWQSGDSQLRVTGGMGLVLFVLTALLSFGWAFYTRHQRVAQLRVAESEERYRALVETAPMAVIVHRDGEVLFSNAQAARMLGLRPGEDLAGHALLDRVDRGDRDSFAADLRAALTEAEAISSGAVRFLAGDGEAVETEVMSTRVGLAGQPAVLSVVHDVTQRHRAEMERERLLESLQRSNEDLQQFAYIASHDLQEPLRNVASYVQLLGRRYRGRLDSDADDFIAYAVNGTKRMQDMITNLLDYSRLQRVDDEPEPVDASEPLNEALADLGAAIDETGAMVEVLGTMPVVRVWRVELMRIFLNLIGNGIKYRRSDTIPRITIGARRDGLDWIFSISDNGIGMAPTSLDHIFTLFQRLHSRETYDGTGIGLAICRKLVQHNGGRIWAESELGRGSTFYFSLPAAE